MNLSKPLEPSLDRKINEVFRWSNTLFTEGKFQEVEDELRALDLTKLPTSTICAYQVVANLPKNAGEDKSFPYRREFQARAREEFERRGEPEVEGLMNGFERD
jgi:hypothetical protein